MDVYTARVLDPPFSGKEWNYGGPYAFANFDLSGVWLLARESRIVHLKSLKFDAASFFALPIPKSVWERTKKTKDVQFVKFVEKALRSPPD